MSEISSDGVVRMYGVRGNGCVLDLGSLLNIKPEDRERYDDYDTGLQIAYTYTSKKEDVNCTAVCVWQDDHWRIDDMDLENRAAFYAVVYPDEH